MVEGEKNNRTESLLSMPDGAETETRGKGGRDDAGDFGGVTLGLCRSNTEGPEENPLFGESQISQLSHFSRGVRKL